MTIKNCENNSNFFQHLLKSQNLEKIEINIITIDLDQSNHLKNLIKKLKHVDVSIRELNKENSLAIIEGLKENEKIEFFSLFPEDIYDISLEEPLIKYYNYAESCSKLSNIQIVFFLDPNSEEKKKNWRSIINQGRKSFEEFTKKILKINPDISE